jgi:hypothetical protein
MPATRPTPLDLAEVLTPHRKTDEAEAAREAPGFRAQGNLTMAERTRELRELG